MMIPATTSLKCLALAVNTILMAAELEEYQNQGLIARHEAVRLYVEQREVRNVYQTSTETEQGNDTD